MKVNLPPLNRLVAFAGPYIALASGALSSYLVVHVQILGSLGLGKDGLAHAIAYGATAAVGALVPHLGMEKWLDGHQQFTDQVLHLIGQLEPNVQHQVAIALPAANGDFLKALETALPGAGGTLTAPKVLSTEDAFPDVEEENTLIDVGAPDLDPLPGPGEIADDRVHAPAGADTGAEAQATPAAGAAA